MGQYDGHHVSAGSICLIRVLSPSQSGFLGLAGNADLRSVVAAADSGMTKPAWQLRQAQDIPTCGHRGDMHGAQGLPCSVESSMCDVCPFCVQVFIHRIRKYLGAYVVLLEGATDAIVFSAGALLCAVTIDEQHAAFESYHCQMSCMIHSCPMWQALERTTP